MSETASARAARVKGFALVTTAYVAATAVGLGAAHAALDAGPVVALGAGYLASALAVFVWSRAFENSSFFDAWWMVAPFAAAMTVLAGLGSSTRRWIITILVAMWACRLTWNWIRGWHGLHQEDWRYLEMKEKTGRWYWWVSLGALHLFPGALVFLGSLSIVVSMQSEAPWGVLDWIALIVTLTAIALEAISDEQLHSFAARKPARGAICDVGLWKYSRHPNYCGEMMFWLGLFLFVIAANSTGWWQSAWWAAFGPASMIALFVFGTIPMMETRQLARRPEAYAAYQKQVSMVVPWFRRNAGAAVAESGAHGRRS